jgi:hypothetical protein
MAVLCIKYDLRDRMIMVKIKSLQEMYQSGTISFEVDEATRHELDNRLFRLEKMGAR